MNSITTTATKICCNTSANKKKNIFLCLYKSDENVSIFFFVHEQKQNTAERKENKRNSGDALLLTHRFYCINQ